MKTLIKIFTFIVVVGVVSGVVWLVLQSRKSGQDPIALVSQISGKSVLSFGQSIPQQSLETQTFISTLQRVSTIKPLRADMFLSPVYTNLKNNSVIITPDTNPGRANPFIDIDGNSVQ